MLESLCSSSVRTCRSAKRSVNFITADLLVRISFSVEAPRRSDFSLDWLRHRVSNLHDLGG